MASYQELMIPMKILDWIDINKLQLSKMSLNENAVAYLYQHSELINWRLICKNKNAIYLINMLQYKEIRWSNWTPVFLSWIYLSENENAIELLWKNIEKIDWYYLSCNKNGIDILKYYKDKIIWPFLCEQEKAAKWIYTQYPTIKDDICWDRLCENQSIEAMLLLEDNKDKINYTLLSGNKFAERFFKDNLDKICYDYLSSNESKWAMDILKYHLDKANWLELSTNYYAIDILKNNIDKIFWCDFCINKNPEAIPIIKDNLSRLRKMDWSILSTNSNAIEILKDNQDKISFNNLTYNPAIFMIDYEVIKKKTEVIKKDIIEKALNPRRFTYYLTHYSYNICNDEYDDEFDGDV